MKFYAVKEGRIPGVYTSWPDCQKQTNGYSGAVFKSFSSREEALNFISPSPKETKNSKEDIVYCDGGHNSQTGKDAWGSVVDKDGYDLVSKNKHLLTDFILRDEILPLKGKRTIIVANFNDVKSQQNNGAELMAMVAGLRICLEKNHKVLASDSELLVKWWSNKLNDDKRSIMDPRKVNLIDELIILRKKFEQIGGSIIKISGDDNKADLGHH